jgi:hypothetical protein
MLYVAFFKVKPGLTAGSPEIIEKSRKWWDQGGKPAGLKDCRCLRLPRHRHSRRAHRGPKP